MRRPRLCTSVLLAALTATAPASAEEICGQQLPRPSGPVAVGLLDGQLATARRACPRNEVSLAGDGYVVADLANFYGNIRIDGILAGSWAITELTELFAAMGLVRYQTVISSVAAAYLGTGYLSLGASHRLLSWDDGTMAIAGRIVLPTTSGLDRNSAPLGGDLGLTATWMAHRTVDLHGSVVFGGSLGISEAPPLPRGTARLAAALDWHPLRWLGVAAELGAGFGYRGPFDHLAGSIAFRFGIVSGFGAELAATYAFVGEEPALLAGFLRLSWRFPGPSSEAASPAEAPHEAEEAAPAEESEDAAPATDSASADRERALALSGGAA